MVKVAASILAANQDALGKEIMEVCTAGCDLIHIDVMDGLFVDNSTNGVYMMKASLKNSSVPLDVHLMVNDPLKHAKKYLKADCITFHIEAAYDEVALKVIEYLRSKNIKVGISIKPNTSIQYVKDYIDKIDKVLVMTVEPGFGGQMMIPETLNKVKELRELYPDLEIQVDGGINIDTYKLAVKAGANNLVVGTALFGSDNKKKLIKLMKR